MRRLCFLSLALLLCSCTAQTTNNSSSSASSDSTSTLSSAEPETTYVSPNDGYSINYPATWTVNGNDTLITPDSQRTGTAFIGTDVQPGTVLMETKVHVAKQSGTCTLQPNEQTQDPVTINGTTFNRSTWSDVGAGNLYEGMVFSTEKNGSCYLLTLFTHSCNLGFDCSAGHQNPVDKKLLEKNFVHMMQTFTLQ